MNSQRINSRQKGARGERQWRDELRAHGYDARRGQQFSGSPESPDVVCDVLGWAHFEVKAVERLNIEDAMEQARRDGAAKIPLVVHKRNFRPWLVTMTAETFFRLLRGELPPRRDHGTTGPSEKLKAETLKAERGTTGPQDHGTTGPWDHGTKGRRRARSDAPYLGRKRRAEDSEPYHGIERRSQRDAPYLNRFFGGGVCRGHSNKQQTTERRDQ